MQSLGKEIRTISRVFFFFPKFPEVPHILSGRNNTFKPIYLGKATHPTAHQSLPMLTNGHFL